MMPATYTSRVFKIWIAQKGDANCRQLSSFCPLPGTETHRVSARAVDRETLNGDGFPSPN